MFNARHPDVYRRGEAALQLTSTSLESRAGAGGRRGCHAAAARRHIGTAGCLTRGSSRQEVKRSSDVSWGWLCFPRRLLLAYLPGLLGSRLELSWGVLSPAGWDPLHRPVPVGRPGLQRRAELMGSSLPRQSTLLRRQPWLPLVRTDRVGESQL